MIQFTPDEFNKTREGVAAAHLFCQKFTPIIKQRRIGLNRDERNLLTMGPEAIAVAFNTMAAITHRENRDLCHNAHQPTTEICDIDTAIMQEELANVSALNLPDIEAQVITAIKALPAYDDIRISADLDSKGMAKIMAWAWEAGRRYGILTAIAIVEGANKEYVDGTVNVLNFTLDAALQLPSPETAAAPARLTIHEVHPASKPLAAIDTTTEPDTKE